MKFRFIYVALALVLLFSLPSVTQQEAAAQSLHWETRAPLPQAMTNVGSVAVLGKIHAISKTTGHGPSLHYEYDPATDSWTLKTTPPLSDRYNMGSAVYDDKIYLFGGVEHGGPLSNVAIYDPATDNWSTGTSMPVPSNGSTATVVNDKMYIVGGSIDGTTGGSNVVQVYDPVADSWSTGANTPTTRQGVMATAVNGKIYVIGGRSGGTMYSVVEEYDPVANTWTTRTPIPTAARSGVAAALNNRIFVTSEAYLGSTVYIYDPATDNWSIGPSIPTARYAFSDSSDAVLNNAIYVVGGQSIATSYEPTVEVLCTSVGPPTVIFSDDFEYDDSLENHGWIIDMSNPQGDPQTAADPENAGNRAAYIQSRAEDFAVFPMFHHSFSELTLQPGMEISIRFYDTGESCGNCDVWTWVFFDNSSDYIMVGWYNSPSNFCYAYSISGSWSGELYEPYGLRGVGWHTFTWRVEQNGGIDLLIDGNLVIDDLAGFTTLSKFRVNSGSDGNTYSFAVDDFSVTSPAYEPTASLTIKSTSGGGIYHDSILVEGTYNLPVGTVFPFNAVAYPGYFFSHWSGDTDSLVSAGPHFNGIIVNSDCEITAHFGPENGGVDIGGLRGVSYIPPYWRFCDITPGIDTSRITEDLAAIKNSWNGSVVRIPITPSLWDADPNAYDEILDAILEKAAELDLAVIIDWHAFGDLSGTVPLVPGCLCLGWDYEMMNQPSIQTTIDFWKYMSHYIADKYDDLDEPTIIYEVFNEPYHIGWTEWAGHAENIIDEIRLNDPDRVILVGGVTVYDEELQYHDLWGYDLSGVNSRPIERFGIAYVSHPYPRYDNWEHEETYNGDSEISKSWDEAFGDIAEAGRHVFVTEWGFDNDGGEHKNHLGTTCYGDSLVNYLAEHNIGWTAWVFSNDWTPSLLAGDGLQNWNAEDASSPFGEFVSYALGGNVHIDYSDWSPAFIDDFCTLDMDTWDLSTGIGPGEYYPTTFDPNNVITTPQDELQIRVPYQTRQGGQIVTDDVVSYGRYRVRMKASLVDNTIQGFFVYAPPYACDMGHREIDVEFGLTDHRNEISFGTWIDGVKELIPPIALTFDPSEEYYEYGFDWYEDRVDFYVGPLCIWQSTWAISPDPLGQPLRLMVNNWVKDWPSNNPPLPQDDSYLLVDWVSYQPQYEELVFQAFSPVDISIVDPDGLVIDIDTNEITGATYAETDLDSDGDLDDLVTIPQPRFGDYRIAVVPDLDADPSETYTLQVVIDGQTIVLAENTPISEIPDQGYIVRCDAGEVTQIVPATMDFDPPTLNLKSKGKGVTAYVELPTGYDMEQIDISSIMLSGVVPALVWPTEIGDHDNDDIPDLMVKFDRAAVQALVQVGESVEITVTGEVGGIVFEGTDTIRVIRP